MALEANPWCGESSLIFLTTILQQLSIAMQLISYFKNISVFTESSASLGKGNSKNKQTNKKNNYFQFSSQMLAFGSYDTKAESQTGKGKVFGDLI